MTNPTIRRLFHVSLIGLLGVGAFVAGYIFVGGRLQPYFFDKFITF